MVFSPHVSFCWSLNFLTKPSVSLKFGSFRAVTRFFLIGVTTFVTLSLPFFTSVHNWTVARPYRPCHGFGSHLDE